MTIFTKTPKEIVGQHQRGSSEIGYASGVFDLLHQGHSKYLSSCRKRCDILIVGVDDDALVKKNKGECRPYETIIKRLEGVWDTNLVDEIFIKSSSSVELLKILQPEKYFIPNNRRLSAPRIQLLEHLSIELIVIPYTEGISTSIIAQQGPPGDAIQAACPKAPHRE